MNRHVVMIALCGCVVIPMAETVPSRWMAIIQAAAGGASIGAHLVMWGNERRTRRLNRDRLVAPSAP